MMQEYVLVMCTKMFVESKGPEPATRCAFPVTVYRYVAKFMSW